MDEITFLGDYKEFYILNRDNLTNIGIDFTVREISHLGYKTASLESYKSIRNKLLPLTSEYLENEHNGRPILKAVLAQPLELDENVFVSLIELMPPKPDKQYEDGLEHLGVVLSSELVQFKQDHKDKITEIQDQGPFCQPACILFENGKRVKFYEYSLKKAIELEGQVFIKQN